MASLLFRPLFTSSVVVKLKASSSPSARCLPCKTQCLLLDHHQCHKRTLPSLWLAERKEDGSSSRRRRGGGAAAMRWRCSIAYLPPETVQWVCSISVAVLMLARGTAIQKQFLVPLFALQAPQSVVAWARGEYGVWSAFLALLVRLFYFIPGELELPFIALLLLIVAPYQASNLRGTQAGAIVSWVIAAYIAYQHFSRIGSLQKAFDQVSIIATLAVLAVVSMLCISLL
ncbi:cold-regulated 413 inner membrane protein 1, chloroplastic-like isoform X2 [Nymphaea colorata]|uniref:cold-regulated 413 inner membrane protein 1, chloroplastic-like isoform X2 n=1 Tax=Nymphaea colorata TaxID=210225 RepID=UPI00129D3CC3|nr:cold-regulated 413 inner membrane protein 1, chloroplastic-like isoform X2 [Nymphaea colorata]